MPFNKEIKEDFLHSQLIKLGDMIADGLHHEPDGKWISREYKKICKLLGIGPKRKNNVNVINKAMNERLLRINCPKCSGKLKQTKSGSMRAICIKCDCKFQILKRVKKRK